LETKERDGDSAEPAVELGRAAFVVTLIAFPGPGISEREGVGLETKVTEEDSAAPDEEPRRARLCVKIGVLICIKIEDKDENGVEVVRELGSSELGVKTLTPDVEIYGRDKAGATLSELPGLPGLDVEVEEMLGLATSDWVKGCVELADPGRSEFDMKVAMIDVGTDDGDEDGARPAAEPGRTDSTEL
jgi:hypothetical protein